MNNKITKNNGITLVALVVTIVILLILAGISISALTQTGIFGKAKQATEKYKEAEEKERIQTELYYMQIGINTNSDSKKQLGKKLYDKNIENGSKWDIIVINDSKKTYGTGWSFIEKGSKIGNTTTNKAWIINDSTQEIIKLEDDSYTELSYASSVGTTEGLIFNLDPSIIENATKDNINEKLGENVELINFDWNENSGLTKSNFNFDGVNDYIKIKYDNEEEKNILAQNGLTFEFYGIYDGGTSYNPDNTIKTDPYKGLFCYWNGVESNQAAARFGFGSYGKKIEWNTGGYRYEEISDYSQDGYPWNICYPETEEIQSNKEIYFTISIDCSQENFKHTFYANGNKLYEGKLNKDYWNDFSKNKIQNLKYFCVGRSSMNKNGSWHYSKMNAYSIKLYNRGLNEQEVKENYNKSVAYHNLLQ